MKINPKTIIIADDHPLILSGLRHELEKQDQFKVIDQASNGQNAWKLIQYHQPDLCIMDIQMPELSGLEVAQHIFENRIETSVILMTMYHDLGFLEKARKYDVKGYLLKDFVMDELHSCIRDVLQGSTYLSQTLETLQKEMEQEMKPLESLSRMEKKVFKLVGEGLSTKEISELLFISPKTAENHRYNISQKLQLKEKKTTLIEFSRSFFQPRL